MQLIRWFLGKLILLVDTLFSPKGLKRSPEAQSKVDEQATHYALYQFAACPFCVKVRRAMKRQSVTIELRDAKTMHSIVMNWSKAAEKSKCLV